MPKSPDDLTFVDLEEADRDLEAAEGAYEEALVHRQGLEFAQACHDAAWKRYLTVLGILERKHRRFETAEMM